jgi:hypothetical protein
MSCTQIGLLALLLAAARAPAGAQTSHPSAGGLAHADTVMIAWFALYGGRGGVAGQPVTLQHRLAGALLPTQFRVSRFPDFGDAAWQPYPSDVPRWSSPSFSGSCGGAGSGRLVAYFQVRAPRGISPAPQSFVLSNVARDTTCVLIGY